MFPEELKRLNIYAPEKEDEIMDILKDFFVVTSIDKDYPVPRIHRSVIIKHDNSHSFGNADILYTNALKPLNCQFNSYRDALYLAYRDFSTNLLSEVDSILNNKSDLKEGYYVPYIGGLYFSSAENKSAQKIATEKKKLELNLDQSLNNYLIAEDLLKKMFLRNPQKTLRVLRKIYYPIMIDAKMQELADSAEELKTLKSAFGKLQSKKYRPDLRTEIFIKMRAVCDETGASYDKLKTLNATKGGLSKAAKGKFAEK